MDKKVTMICHLRTSRSQTICLPICDQGCVHSDQVLAGELFETNWWVSPKSRFPSQHTHSPSSPTTSGAATDKNEWCDFSKFCLPRSFLVRSFDAPKDCLAPENLSLPNSLDDRFRCLTLLNCARPAPHARSTCSMGSDHLEGSRQIPGNTPKQPTLGGPGPVPVSFLFWTPWFSMSSWLNWLAIKQSLQSAFSKSLLGIFHHINKDVLNS